MNNNIILTGPPRSGTTLACFLLNKVENTIALHEPMSLKMFPDSEQGLNSIRKFFPEMRNSLLKSGMAYSKVKEGNIPSNPFVDNTDKNRSSIVSKELVHFNKHLESDFKLIIKHNGHFTFLLPDLQNYYPVFILIRNPVSTIASWNSINAPVSGGNLKVLEFLNPELFNQLNSIPDLITRQVTLLDQMYLSYIKATKADILRYEDIISSGGKSLNIISSKASLLNEPLSSKNTNPLYNSGLIDKIKLQLLQSAGAYLQFYSNDSIENF